MRVIFPIASCRGVNPDRLLTLLLYVMENVEEYLIIRILGDLQ
jgi:hypothetical protein